MASFCDSDGRFVLTRPSSNEQWGFSSIFTYRFDTSRSGSHSRSWRECQVYCGDRHRASHVMDVKVRHGPRLTFYSFISEWAKSYPSANVLGVEGLPEKREKNPDTKGTKFTHVWTKANKREFRVDEDFEKDFDYEFVDGHQNKELVLNYKPDRTLIQADLFFNLPATEQYSKSGESATSGILTKLFGSFMNTRGAATGQKRFLWYAPTSADRKSFNESVKRIDSWDFDRVIPCHGDVIETGGKGIFQKVMEWHLKGSK